MRISVIAIGDSGEAKLILDLLEAQDHQVRLVLAGKPSDVFTGFDFFGMPADAAVLAAHGDDKGIVFPEMALGVDALELPDDRLTPSIIRDNLRAVSPLVVSTACSTGLDAFASVFIAVGAQHYVAPLDYPEGADIAIWIAVFFRLLAQDDVRTALARANAAVDPDSGFRAFRAPHERS